MGVGVLDPESELVAVENGVKVAVGVEVLEPERDADGELVDERVLKEVKDSEAEAEADEVADSDAELVEVAELDDVCEPDADEDEDPVADPDEVGEDDPDEVPVPVGVLDADAL